MWKDIPGYETLYQINERGDVKSIQRHIENGSKHGMLLPERILAQSIAHNGYCYVTLRKNNTSKHHYVHRLVASAFLQGTGATVNHIDGNKHNNCVENLEYVSYSQNNQHAYDLGLHGKGEQHYKSKLTRHQVDVIRQEAKYATYQEIADKYNVSKATIRDVLLHKTWK